MDTANAPDPATLDVRAPPTERSPHPPGAALPRSSIPYILITLGTFAVVTAVRAHAPAAGEELALRWLRTASDHPVRTLSALLLVTWALSPRRSPL